MNCKHTAIRCTNGVFYCLECGAEIPNPYEKQEKPEAKKPVKRKTKKESEAERICCFTMTDGSL